MRFELVNFSEIDKDAIKSYCAIHNVEAIKNLGDIEQIKKEELSKKGITLITHGSPCVAFSKAGRQEGGDKGSGTPSSLMWYSVEIIRYVSPKFVIWENVSNVLSSKHKHNFEEYIKELDEIGYFSYYAVLNAKDYNTPQNRNRIFVISIRKDIDKGFYFPDKVPLNIKLKDILEQDVDKKYYLTQKQIDIIRNSTYSQNKRRIQVKDYCATLCARDWKDVKCIEDSKGIRKFTPREYWRIQGFKDSDFEKAQKEGISNSSLYKQAGNSIAYNILLEIFKILRKEYPEELVDDFKYISLFSGIGAFEMALRDV